MKQTAFLISLIILMAGCSGSYSYKDISEFNLQQDSLATQSIVRLIHFSGGPDLNKDREYYYQYIVINSITKDTVRVLCQYHLAYNTENTLMLRYISADTQDKREMAILLAMADREKFEETEDIEEIESVPFPSIDRVAANEDLNKLETGNYPTVIGLLIEDPAMQHIPRESIVK